MLSGLFTALIGFFNKLLGMLPHSPFNFDTYVAALDKYLPWVNWFVPFYVFDTIFKVFLTTFFGSLVVVFLIKFVLKKIGG